jgi:hypothetical protein
MPRRARKSLSPVTPNELTTAILVMIARKFGDRPLSWETLEEALREVNIEIKLAALRRKRPSPRAPRTRR